MCQEMILCKLGDGN